MSEKTYRSISSTVAQAPREKDGKTLWEYYDVDDDCESNNWMNRRAG